MSQNDYFSEDIEPVNEEDEDMAPERFEGR